MRIKRVILTFPALVLIAATLAIALPGETYAANITARSLTLQAGASAGGSQPSGVVNHLFTFTLPSTSLVKSIQFQYCTNANIDIGGTCTTPHGLVTTAATLGTQTGYTFNSLVNTTNGAPYLTSTAGITPSGTTSETIQLLSVTNPDGSDCGVGVTNCTFFVRITTYSTATPNSADIIDAGTVAAAVSTQIVLTGTMPESLIFCTGGKVSTNGNGIPDCTTATSGNITFTQLFSPTSTVYASSQMAASTNASQGYAITVSGTTLTSGANTITALAANAASSQGSSQFGINLKANTTPSVGTNVSGTGSGTAATNYNTADSFRFATGETVASASAATNSNTYTVSYIANIAGTTKPGSYSTALTYTATPTF